MNQKSELLQKLDNNLILGLHFKELKSWPDNRGFFREIIRSNDPFFKLSQEDKFAQWSHSKMTKDVVKAWHYHHKQIDWWYLAIGQIQAVFFDNRPESKTYKKKISILMGEAKSNCEDKTFEVCVRIPQGVLHGLKVLSDEAHLFYITSEIYNPDDEGRFCYNSEIVAQDWGDNAIVTENDCRDFVPKTARVVDHI